jgi:hypothetical protein
VEYIELRYRVIPWLEAVEIYLGVDDASYFTVSCPKISQDGRWWLSGILNLDLFEAVN